MKKATFVPTPADLDRRARIDISLIPKSEENARTIITNEEYASLFLLQREPRDIKELAAEIGKWRQRDINENSYLESLRNYFDVKNGMASMPASGGDPANPYSRKGQALQAAYLALRKMELVGWLKHPSK